MSYIAYLDCHSGIDADMLLGALCDAGLSLSVLQQTLSLLPLQDYHLALERVVDKGVQGTRVIINHATQKREIYTWSEVQTLLSSPSLSPYIRDTTLAILQKIAEAIVDAETPFAIETRSLISVISVVVGLKELQITQLYASALPLTSGFISTSSAQVSGPKPVTLEMLRRVSAVWQPVSLSGEGVTTLAAALLATFARFDTPTMTIQRVSYGFASETPVGTDLSRPGNGVGQHVGNASVRQRVPIPTAGRDKSVPTEHPSPPCLRLYLATLHEREQQTNGDADSDWVTVLSTNIDNMSGELLGGLMDRLLIAGALDVSYTPMQMKKNRPAIMLMVVCPLEKGNELAYILLRETTTLGVRIQQVQRLKARRSPQQIDTPLGPMLIKVKRLGTQIISASPEYEECQRIAQKHNIPLADVYTIAQQAIATSVLENVSHE